MNKINKWYRLSPKKLFETDDDDKFEFVVDDYSDVSRNIVVKVDESENCKQLFDSLLEAIPAKQIKFHILKEATERDQEFTSLDVNNCKSMVGSIFYDISKRCELFDKTCAFSCLKMKNGQLKSLKDYSKQVNASHVFDLSRLANEQAIKVFGNMETVKTD